MGMTAKELVQVLKATCRETEGLEPNFGPDALEFISGLWGRGVSYGEIARMCKDKYGTKPVKPTGKEIIFPDQFYTLEAHHVGGPLFKVYPHVLGRNLTGMKRAASTSAGDGERLRFKILREGVTEQRAGEFMKPNSRSQKG